ncbi:MAG TPA: YdhR family protein [Acidimicrobiales bacterium]|nr:YdhR family protein [Acidimicrobiales bacterium]
MYVQIVTYNLNGVSEQDYIDIAHQVAPQFAAMGGLEAKVWLRNEESESFGAVYFWQDRESQERFVASDLFEATYPGFVNVVSAGYEVYEHLTRATQPMLDILEEEAGWAPPPPPLSEPIEEPEPMDEEADLIEFEDLEPDDEAELLEPEDLEPEDLEPEDLEPAEAVVMEEPEPVVRVTRRVVKRSPKKAPAKKAAVRKAPVGRAARSTKVIKVTKKAAPARRAVANRVTKVAKVTKKLGKRPVKAAKKAKKLR